MDQRESRKEPHGGRIMSATTNNPLAQSLARCFNAAHEVYNVKELDESLIAPLILAAAILDAGGNEINEKVIECIRDLRNAIWEELDYPGEPSILLDAAITFDQQLPAEIDIGKRIRVCGKGRE
jgi:hypothetical protein